MDTRKSGNIRNFCPHKSNAYTHCQMNVMRLDVDDDREINILQQHDISILMRVRRLNENRKKK